jgi:nicotinate phosphoribosyltransferase
LSNNSFFLASEDEIKNARTTDVYFLRTEEVLKKNAMNLYVAVEITPSSIKDSDWGVLSGVEDVLELLQGLNIDVYSMPEGTIFRKEDQQGVKIPTMVIVGKYLEFGKFETPLLGFLCSKSGMTTRAARIRLVAKDKNVLSFGARRAHPAITPVVSYCAYIGGCDGISCILGAEKLGIQPTGTIPHALIIMFQDQVAAWKAFDKDITTEVPRIALVDTYFDEKIEALLAANAIPNLHGVRLDTPSSRKGNFKSIIQEVRWELDYRGFSDVKIYISGGLGEQDVIELVDIVDGFGIGSTISAAPPIDFALDIVAMQDDENDWLPVAKRGKFSGLKQVVKCNKCLNLKVIKWDEDTAICQNCHNEMKHILIPQIKEGERITSKPSINDVRSYISDQLSIFRNQQEKDYQ